MKKHGLDRLGADERLDLLEELWVSLDADTVPVTDAQRIELEARRHEHETNPDDVVSWEDAKDSALPPRGKR